MLSGELYNGLEDKLKKIAKTIQGSTRTANFPPGLMSGLCGLSVFFFYYARMTKDPVYEEIANSLLSEAFERINGGYTYHTFCDGLAGIGWTIVHLAKNGFIDSETVDMFGPIDSYLSQQIIHEVTSANFDFLHGSVGVGFYFISRPNSADAVDGLDRLVNGLERFSQVDSSGGCRWRSVLDHEKGTRGFNLSLSHGISSIIILLAELLRKRKFGENTSSLLKRAVYYMLSQKKNSDSFGSSFPSWVTESGQSVRSRLGWCYGDLGIGIALLRAASVTGEREWHDLAIDVLLQTTKRRDLETANIFDAGICHGTAGLALIYRRLYEELEMDEFKDSALFWASQTLKMADHPEGYAGYSVYHTEKYGGWYPQEGLLMGIAGIGLMMISMLSDIEPKWDACLLLSEMP